MDELDVKIFRALISERMVAPSNSQLNTSLRSIASRLGADDMTVNYRFKRLQKSGFMSGWELMVNPTFFGCKMVDVTVDVQPESAKPDMIRKLKLIHEITGMNDFYGRALKLIVMFNSEESRSRTIELISRITNAEAITQVRWALPQSKTERLTENDVAIIRSLSHDANKNLVQVAKEVGLSSRAVRNRLGRLRMENTVFAFPILNMNAIPGLIPVYLSFTYVRSDVKGAVDRAVVSNFDSCYFSVQLSDPNVGYVVLSASTMTEVREYLEWAKLQSGVASTRVDILVKTMIFPDKLTELLDLRNEKSVVQKDAFF